ncbi:hypothetical protein L1887_56414 [Cichorium endivia]|nr:hypothetical protein L1887_56414 [Cichorium endivia]
MLYHAINDAMIPNTTSSARQRHVRRAVGRVARVEVAGAEADEGDPDAEEERVEGERRAEEGESGVVVWSLSAVCFSDSEAAGDFEDREAHPKAAVRREGAASEGVPWIGSVRWSRLLRADDVDR